MWIFCLEIRVHLLPLTNSDFGYFWFAGENPPKYEENKVWSDFVFFSGNGVKYRFLEFLDNPWIWKIEKNSYIFETWHSMLLMSLIKVKNQINTEICF